MSKIWHNFLTCTVFTLFLVCVESAMHYLVLVSCRYSLLSVIGVSKLGLKFCVIILGLGLDILVMFTSLVTGNGDAISFSVLALYDLELTQLLRTFSL